MSDFQLGLILVGALAVAGVLLYNHWQERRTRREGEARFAAQHPDALLEKPAVRREPSLAPSLSAPTTPAAPAELPSMTGVAALPDERIDYVIDATFPAPVHGSAWIESWRALERRFKHRVLLAVSADGTHWEPLGPAPQSWTRYRAGLQLVSRDGTVGEGETLEFRSTVEGITAGLSGVVQPTDLRAALDRARQLDALCAQADIEIAFHLRAPLEAAFPLDAVRRAAAQAGLHEQDGAFSRVDALGGTLFRLAADHGPDRTRAASLTFSLDVPRSTDLRRAYRTMIAGAQQLAAALGGSLVDDNGAPLDERALEAIWRGIEAVGQALEASGLAAGSPLARRLFS